MAKKYQALKVKYYIFHNKSSNDVFIWTASKSWDRTEEKAKELYPNEYEEWQLGNSNYGFDLFELDLIDNN